MISLALKMAEPDQLTHDNSGLGDTRRDLAVERTLGKAQASLTATYTLVWQNRCTVDIQLVLDRHIVTEDCDVFDPTLSRECCLSTDPMQVRIRLPICRRCCSNR